MHQDEREVAEALALLRAFGTRILPGTLRRIARWKRLARDELPDLCEELMQELAVDCLEHTATITTMPTAQRNGRWMRMAERWVYRHHVRPRVPPAAPPPRLSMAPAAADVAAAAEQDEPPEVPRQWVQLGNGRRNLTASAVREGRPLAALQSELEQLVVQLGCDGEHDAFWRARLAEALTGLAADLLRRRGMVRLLPGPRCRPDPERRLDRMRSLGRRFHLRPSTIDVRRILRYWTVLASFDEAAPERLLLDAVRVWPHSTVAWLWLGEAALARGDLRAALAAMRMHRRLPPSQPGRTTLLRARVLEMRGRWSAAVHLLQRAHRRWPHEVRLRRALDAIRA
jgi:hypothetical protein